MLQKVDKDRLDKVLRAIDRAMIRFPITELSAKTGIDKGNVSKYLKGKKPMPERFYTTIEQLYGPFVEASGNVMKEPEAQYETGDTVDMLGLIKKMVENTSTLVESNLILTKTNATQTELLQKLTGGGFAGTSEASPATLAEYQDKLIQAGIGKYWSDYAEGFAALNSLIFGQQSIPKKSIRKSADISGK